MNRAHWAWEPRKMESQLRHFRAAELTSKKAILVIDDSQDSLLIGRAILERDGFNVLTASSGAEAFRILEEIQDLDLVLLDQHMTDMSGIDFLERLDRTTPNFLSNVPVVFYSAAENIPPSKASGSIRKAGDINHFLRQVHSYVKMH